MGKNVNLYTLVMSQFHLYIESVLSGSVFCRMVQFTENKLATIAIALDDEYQVNLIKSENKYIKQGWKQKPKGIYATL